MNKDAYFGHLASCCPSPCSIKLAYIVQQFQKMHLNINSSEFQMCPDL